MKRFAGMARLPGPRNTSFSCAVLIGLILAGVAVAWHSEIEAFPELTNVQVQVITLYPGKAAEEVERQLTVPLEVATNGIAGLINQRSVSLFGLSVITLTFNDNISLRDARMAVSQNLNDVICRPAFNRDSPLKARPWGKSSATRSRGAACR